MVDQLWQVDWVVVGLLWRVMKYIKIMNIFYASIYNIYVDIKEQSYLAICIIPNTYLLFMNAYMYVRYMFYFCTPLSLAFAA